MSDENKLSLGLNLDFRLLRRTDHPGAQLRWGANKSGWKAHGWSVVNDRWVALCGVIAVDQEGGVLRMSIGDDELCPRCRDIFQSQVGDWVDDHQQWGE